MSNVAVLYQNYANPSFYQALTYSSQLAATPVTNILDGVRRSKVYRSAGYWLITSANKGIVLQTAAGVNQTVNIAEGAYTTDATFLAAVDTALTSETSGAAFTVTRDTTTNKIKITSDGAGGTLLRLMCTNASFTSAAILGFSTAADRTGALTYTADTLKLHTVEFFEFDLGSDFNPKAFFLIGLRNTDIKLSEDATITLKGNTTDVWTSPIYSNVLTYNSNSIGVFNSSGLAASACRYWRLEIIDASNVNGYIEISNIFLGDAIVPTQGAVQFPLKTRINDLSRLSFGRSGNTFSDTIQVSQELTLNWNFLSISEKESLEELVNFVGVNTPFFVCMDPNQVFSSDLQLQVFYVRFMSATEFSLITPGKFSTDWQLREEL